MSCCSSGVSTDAKGSDGGKRARMAANQRSYHASHKDDEE